MQRIKLCLNFDVNKTLVLTDVASGQSLEESVSNIVSEEALGVVSNDGKWTAVPGLVRSSNKEQHVGKVTFADWTRSHVERKTAKKLRMKFLTSDEGESFTALGQKLIEVAQKSYFLPSFERALDFVANLDESKYEWRLFFRTFGTDLPDVIEEWNAICERRAWPNRKLYSVDSFHRAQKHGST